jgi:hypothetical protein
MIMEDELYREVYRIVINLDTGKTLKRATYTDAGILLVYLWAVLHDRPIYWACKKCNWPIHYRRKKLPNASTMSRRLRIVSLQKLIHNVERYFVDKYPSGVCRWIDAKPLAIGKFSKDRQARFGYADGRVGNGYKLYAVADAYKGFVAWCVKPMNWCESTVADELIDQLDSEGYLVGDGAYDRNLLYDQAAKKSIQLIALPRIKDAKALGHRMHSPHRLRGLSLLNSSIGKSLKDSRNTIETMFGQLTNLGCGLSPLPNWVRTQFRVEMWVRGKMIIYQLWRQRKNRNVA